MTASSAILPHLGFHDIGRFILRDGSFIAELHYPAKMKGTYALTVDGEACFVGQTTDAIVNRIGRLLKPGPRHRKSQYVKERLMAELKRGRKTEIWFLSEEEATHLKVRVSNEGFSLETVSDPQLLERFLITLLRPTWNRGVLLR
jgi:hypothetical protein